MMITTRPRGALLLVYVQLEDGFKLVAGKFNDWFFRKVNRWLRNVRPWGETYEGAKKMRQFQQKSNEISNRYVMYRDLTG
jgi:hypothetical protein